MNEKQQYCFSEWNEFAKEIDEEGNQKDWEKKLHEYELEKKNFRLPRTEDELKIIASHKKMQDSKVFFGKREKVDVNDDDDGRRLWGIAAWEKAPIDPPNQLKQINDFSRIMKRLVNDENDPYYRYTWDYVATEKLPYFKMMYKNNRVPDDVIWYLSTYNTWIDYSVKPPQKRLLLDPPIRDWPRNQRKNAAF